MKHPFTKTLALAIMIVTASLMVHYAIGTFSYLGVHLILFQIAIVLRPPPWPYGVVDPITDSEASVW